MPHRSRFAAAAQAGLLCALVTGGAAQGQEAPKPDASPLAPGDLKKPIFDTVKPVYNPAKGRDQAANTVVAEVDGRTITLGDIGDAVKNLPTSMSGLPFMEVYPTVLEKLIREQALVIRAQHLGLDQDPVVRRKMQEASDRVLANELLLQEVARSITETMLLDCYRNDISGKPGPEEVHLRVIMLPTEAAANDVLAELKAGADFAALAKRSSTDTTASVGGDLGFVARDGLNPEIGAVVFELRPGQTASSPVASDKAWFVVKLEERRRQPTPSFAVVRERLMEQLIQQGAPDVLKKALAGVTIREFSINGKEVAD